jgi:hypothetical protein
VGDLWEGVDEVWLCSDVSHACTGEKVSGWMVMLELKLALEVEVQVQMSRRCRSSRHTYEEYVQMRRGEVAGQETNRTDGEPDSLSLL